MDVGTGESDGLVQLAAGALQGLPVVRGVDAPASAPKGSFGETSATEFETRAALVGQSVPFLGPSGSMIDYGTLTTDRVIYRQKAPSTCSPGPTPPTPSPRSLRDRGLSVSTTLADVQRTLDQGAYALALRLYAVVALLVLLMALAGLFVSTAVQMPARRRDAASLRGRRTPTVRDVGRGPRARRRPRRYGDRGPAAGTLAQYVVLRTVTLGVVESITTPALVAAVDWQRLVVLFAAAALLFGAVAGERGPHGPRRARLDPAGERPPTVRAVWSETAGEPPPRELAHAAVGHRGSCAMTAGAAGWSWNHGGCEVAPCAGAAAGGQEAPDVVELVAAALSRSRPAWRWPGRRPGGPSARSAS